jgi:hypothetical protein
MEKGTVQPVVPKLGTLIEVASRSEISGDTAILCETAH